MALWILVGVLFCSGTFADCSQNRFGEAILAMQVLDAVHQGVDNVYIGRHVG